MLSAFHQPLWVGLNPDSGPKQSQGIVWVEKKEEDLANPYMKSIPMIVRPASATRNGLSIFHYRSLIAQLKKMGVTPASIEIHGKDATYTYSGESFKLLYTKEHLRSSEVPLSGEPA